MKPHWNYRVVRTTGEHRGEAFEVVAIHEAHYDTDGKPRTITADPVTASFDSIEDLRAGLTRMLASLDQPVLNYDDF
jgi:hypothetical protein